MTNLPNRTPDWSVLRFVAKGPTDDGPAFRSAKGALMFYGRAIERRGSPKSMLGDMQDRLRLGLINVQGGKGSTIEDELTLAADVAECFPKPSGEPGTGEDWQAWAAFCSAATGDQIADVARNVRMRTGVDCDWHRAKRLVGVSMGSFIDALRERGLIPARRRRRAA